MPLPGRRDPPTLLVYIRGRWQGVPPGSKFAVARGGRLEELRSGTVRAALRRLQMRQPSKARFGPRLSFKKIPPFDKENSENCFSLKIQPKQITIQSSDVRPSKRKRNNTSSEEPIQSITTVATIHAAKQPKTSKNHQSHMVRLLSSESKSSEKSGTGSNEQTSKDVKKLKSSKKPLETSKTDLINQKPKEILVESPKKSSTSSRTLLDSPKRSLSLKRKPAEQTKSSKQSSPLRKDLTEKQISQYLQPSSGKQNRSPKKKDLENLSDSDFESDQSVILKSKMKQNQSPIKISSTSHSKLRTSETSKLNKQNKLNKIGPKRQKLDQETSELPSPINADNIFQRPNEKYQISNSDIVACKELKIEVEDIELIRKFLQNHYSDRELLRFDEDDDYKRMIFYRINPLVSIEWCPIIDRMLRRSQDSQVTLSDFLSNLGLQSVTVAASKKRYKIRKRAEKNYFITDSDSISDDKEKNDTICSRKEKAKILKEREHNKKGITPEDEEKESKNKVSNKRVPTVKTAEYDSDECTSKENNKKVRLSRDTTTKTNRNADKSDSDVGIIKRNNKKAGKTKQQATREDRNTDESDLDVSVAKRNNKKAEKTKRQTTKDNLNILESESETRKLKQNNTKAGAIDRSTKANCYTIENDSDVSNTKETNKKASYIKKPSKRDDLNSSDSDLEESNAKKVDKNQRERDTTVETVDLSSESDNENAVKTVRRNSKLKDVIIPKQQRTNPEYSSLEDQAIVAWVSTGERAYRVNGNVLWRQLEDRFEQITGCSRTWHSLRNRYLRYILPKLGDLGIPVPQQSQLRSAAAIGEMKGRKASSKRRNSIFKKPPRGAASRKPAAIKHDPENKEPPSNSPRYSSLLRQFTLNSKAGPSSKNTVPSNTRRNKDMKDNTEALGNFPKKAEITVKKSPRKQINNKPTRDEHSDSERRSDSPRRSKDSSDSSSESEDESKGMNGPRRSRRSIHDSNKRMSRSDTRQNRNEPQRRLTRQSNIIDESDESKNRKSRSVNNQGSVREKTNESPRRNLNRSKTSSEQTSRDSSVSMSQTKDKPTENNRRKSRQHTNNRDESNEMKSKSPNRPLSKQSSKGSSASTSQIRRKSKSPIQRKDTRHDSSSEESDSSNESVSRPRRKSNRINTPKDRSNRRRSSRLISPMKQNGRLSSDSPRRKSNRLTPNESSNKRRHSSESKRKLKFAKRHSSDEIVEIVDSSESFETKNRKKDLKNKVDSKRRVEKSKTRRLFNPNAIL